jgi:hypothetical protein
VWIAASSPPPQQHVTGVARDVLHDGHGALADERDWHRVGAHAVARDAAGGVGGSEEGRRRNVSRYRVATQSKSVVAVA